MPTYQFRALYIKNGVGSTPSVAPTVDVCNSLGVLVATDSPAVALAGIAGLYAFAYTGVTADDYVAVFKTTDATFAVQHIMDWTPTVIYTNLDTPISTRLATASFGDNAVTIVNPIAVNGYIEIERGDDYAASDNRSIDFSSTSWPSLTGATVKLYVEVTPTVELSCTVLSATSCRVELTHTQIETIGAGYFNYQLRAALITSGNIVTLQRGTIGVINDIR